MISTLGVRGGAEQFLGALVKEGAGRGWDQVVINPFVKPEAKEDMAALVEPARYVPHSAASPMAAVRARRLVRKEIAAFEADVVHSMLWHATVLVATLRRRPGERRIVTNMYGEALLRATTGRNPWSTRARIALDRWAGRRFDRVIAISQAVQRFLVEHYRYPAEKVVCVPLGWHGRPEPRNSDPRPPTIVCVAVFRSEKGHDVLLEAFSLVRREIPEARLVLVGHGPLAGNISERIRSLSLDGAVDVEGPVDDVWPFLARADVFALASHTEAYGIAVVEAMAAGLPVVASRVGGIPELVQEGVTGELFDPGDADTLAGHLVRLLRSPDVRTQMSQAAQAAAEGHRLSTVLTRHAEASEETVRLSPPAS